MSQQINLFNPAFQKQKNPLSAQTISYVLGLILAGGIVLFAYSAYQAWTLSQQAANVSAQLESTQQQLNQVNAQMVPRKKNQALEDEVNRVQAEHDALERAMGRLQNDEFGNRKGYSAYMRAFARQRVDGLWLTGFSIDGAGNAIGIQGRTLQPELVPAFMKRLGQETVMQGKSFAVLDMHEPKQEAEGSAGAGGARKKAGPDYLEFDLRSAGVAAPLAKPDTTSASEKSASDKSPAPVPATPAPAAPINAQAVKAAVDAIAPAIKALPAADSSGAKKE